ncbi:TSUP family transporter [Arachidicoccus ginsenosidimutans]|uniref:TSUP family transporter n=1 Tax=Arachidicoccus sp. BS20 TaxID=1850526 RepID=UPI0018D3B8ED|nr:TSUP family transporter [Arachidicoccus sp. BS20]
MSNTTTKHIVQPTTNPLFPIFLKLEQLHLLLIGAGNVGVEKLSAVLSNAPETKVTVVAKKVNEDFKQLFSNKENIQIVEKPYDNSDLNNCDIAIIAVNNIALAQQIKADAQQKNILVNVADKPALCDFYLGSIASKGSIKVAISTNGKSPTVAKRLKEIINQSLPEELETSLDNLQQLRKSLNGDFHSKVEKLNEVTQILIKPKEKETVQKPLVLRVSFWKKAGLYAMSVLAIMLFGYWLFGFVLPVHWIDNSFHYLSNSLDTNFFWMFAAGFLAQLVDGAMGMGYGVLSTTLLSSISGIQIAGISSSVHMAEMFSVGTAGISHYKYKHVNKRLWVALVIPGAVGAVLGAIFIGTLGKTFGAYSKPLVAAYTFYLGFKILKKAFKNLRMQRQRKLINVRPVAFVGGFLDAFGGGWGPLVTSTLISGGRDPLYTIGSSTFTKFFTSIASTATFIIVFHQMHFQIIAGLIFGGMIAAPIAAKLSGKFPLKTMFICVGILVMLCSLRNIFAAFL